jgi:COP9 signalosome complex subunit 2
MKNAIVHPRTMGLINKQGGILHMYEHDYVAAITDFSTAFKSYEETSFPELRIQCLFCFFFFFFFFLLLYKKYQILAAMLTNSSINPMGSADHRAYRDDPEIKPLADLIEAYQAKVFKKRKGE